MARHETDPSDRYTAGVTTPTADERFDNGRQLAGRLFRGAPRARPLPAEMARYTMGHLFGDVWQDERLPVEQRSLLTCAVLAATGREAELALHLRGARNLGLARGTVEAMLIHVAHYAGWPAGVSGLRLLDEVWGQMAAEAAGDSVTS
jgi:4-carboxymuconolactone decarboxylase